MDNETGTTETIGYYSNYRKSSTISEDMDLLNYMSQRDTVTSLHTSQSLEGINGICTGFLNTCLYLKYVSYFSWCLC